MPNRAHTLISVLCLALVTVEGCGGSASGPTAPSGSSGATAAMGATITGTVNSGNMVSSAALVAPSGFRGATAPSGMTVTVVGTNLTTSVDVLGQFQLAGVPSGNVQLQFIRGSVSASVQLSNVGEEELVQIQVNVIGTAATIVNEVRATGNVSLCHTTGNGSYRLTEVSVSAEPAHRAHGDAAVGEAVLADLTKVFDANCQTVAQTAAAGVRIKKSTNGQDANQAPGPTIAVGSPVVWQYAVTNASPAVLTNVVVTDDRGVVVSCPSTTLAVGLSMTCTGSGVATAGQYTNVGTVMAMSGTTPVKGSDASHYFGQAVSRTAGVRIKKSTNGQDADRAPGPKIAVGSPVAWQYVVTNTGQVGLTNVVVADDRGVVVTCPGTTLAVAQSMTCTGSGVATAGQYTNIGTVMANSAAGPIKESDPSHYFGEAASGQEPPPDAGKKMEICHRTGNGQYHLLEISVSAEPAHRAHGDAKISEPVPGQAGKVFAARCTVS
jgi:hypothetical protein